MRAALDATPAISAADGQELFTALSRVAAHMVNTPAQAGAADA
jgi:hemoglobin